jgi:hypothetical protein
MPRDLKQRKQRERPFEKGRAGIPLDARAFPHKATVAAASEASDFELRLEGREARFKTGAAAPVTGSGSPWHYNLSAILLQICCRLENR